MIDSRIEDFGPLCLPDYSGIRVMMMPFLMQDPEGSLPDSLTAWRPVVKRVCNLSTVKTGVGYLTIDEAQVKAGETLRRPGLHVDGRGSWGGGPGPAPYAASGMFLVSTPAGCRGYPQQVIGEPGPDGECEHLRDALGAGFLMAPNRLYWCSPMAVHEAIPMIADTKRQVCRVSMPSSAPYHREHTPNPLGILPPGLPMPARPSQMAYRASGAANG